MPIRAENKARYPANWKSEVVPRIRARSGNRCECTGQCGVRHPDFVMVNGNEGAERHIIREPRRCGKWNGMPIDEIEGPKIVLTVAHLGLPAQLPFYLHVTRYAVADEIVDLVGLLVPLDAKHLEWRLMMNNRATAELRRGSPASGAGFLVALPCEPSGFQPGGSVVFDAATAPCGVMLSSFCLSSEPLDTATISAKTAPGTDVKTADLNDGAATFTFDGAQSTLGTAYRLTATGRRTSLASIRSLLRCDWEHVFTNDARDLRRRFSGHAHALLYHMDDYPENCRDENLLHACQGCHNRYDAPVRAAGIKARARAQRAAGDLFTCEETTSG